MKSLAAKARRIYAAFFNRTKKPSRQRFVMEFLEGRVLLSADLDVVPLLIDHPEEAPAEHLVLPTSGSEGSGEDNADVQASDEGKTGDGGDFIDGQAYDETFGEFDYSTFLALEENGPLGGQGGEVDEAPAPADVLTNNNAGNTGAASFTQSETSVIAFGSTVLVAFNDSGSTVGGTNKFTGFSRSTDGGNTFTDGGVLPTSTTGDAGDPVLARNDTTGRIYFATLQFSTSPVNGIAVFHSDDGGLTWSAPAQGAPGKATTGLQDKEWIAVDNFSGAGNGNVYLTERDFGPGNGIYFYRSTDNGNTFGPSGGTLIASAATGNVQGAFVAVAPDHSVYAFWYAGTTIQMRKSIDQGLTFAAPVTVATFITPDGTNGDLALTGIRQGIATTSTFRSNKFPDVAVNPLTGNIYVTYNDNPAGVDKADVFVVQSTDGGATWGARIRVNDDVTITDQWQPTLAVTPGGDKLGIFYSSRQEDPLGNNLFKYYGRIASITGPTLTFAPSFAVSDTASLPEFGRDSLVNPVYMGDYNTAYATPGFFEVSWSDNRDNLPGGAGRKDPNVYYKTIDLGLAVRSTTPSVGSVLSTIPLDYVVTFSDPIQTSTVQATDFKVDGVAANSFIVNPSTTQVTFHFNVAPFAVQGLHTMAMAEGAILRVSDADGLGVFSGTFRYDAALLQVTSTVQPVGGVYILPGPFTYDVNFNEAIDPASIQTSDLVLSGISGAGGGGGTGGGSVLVSAVSVLPGNTTARFAISGITSEGTLTASIFAGDITDAFGNPGATFTGTYSVDVITAAYPTPLTAKNPAGSLIYDPSMTGVISFAGDTDMFTLNVDPGQTISVKVTPTSTTLQPSVQLIDPSSAPIGSGTAGFANQNALIQTAAAAAGGTYQIVVSGAGGSLGGYTVQVTLNAALENEGNIAGATNNSLNSTGRIIDAADSGWLQSNGVHTTTNNNYIVGIAGVESRNYATFTLAATTPAIIGAELRLFNPPTGYNSADPTETYSLFDVTATAAALDVTRIAGDATGIGIFSDLGSGTVYGTRVVSAADNNSTVAITLNAAAVAALNAAIGSSISLGGAITTLLGTSLQTMFSSTSGAVPSVQLVLQTVSANTAENIDSSFITVSTPQASAQRGAVLGQSDAIALSVGFTFEDISATGTVIAGLTNQDDASVSIPVGFAFPFYSVDNTTVFVSSNGLLTFGSGNASGVNTDLTTLPTQATIAPFWDDLHTAGGVAGSNVFYQMIGSGANQHLTIQWNKVRFAVGGTAGDTITFQVQLYADGRIQFNYPDLVSGTAAGNNGASATVGFKAAGTQGPNRSLLVFNNGPATPNVGTGRSTLILPSRPPDYFAFTLNTGETVTLAATALITGSGNVSVELRDSSDTVLATGVGGSSNLTSVINNFSVTTGGTYYARITGDTLNTQYSLVVTRNAAFDTEGNSTAATSQTLDGAPGALGDILAVATVNAVDSGWIFGDGSHGAANNNYVAGQGLNPTLAEFHNYATFTLGAATPTIIGAELRLFNPASGYNSPDPSETYTLFDVSATPAALDTTRLAGDATGILIHADLGSGTVYGSRVVSAADNGTNVAITLNADAIAALNAAIGSTISFGGALTTLAGTATQFIFGASSGALGTVQLVLQTVPDPDWYSISLPITANALRLQTSTPGDGPREPVNTLNPKIELYDNTGTTLLASGVVGPDGRNESIVITGLTPGGTYKVRVSGESGTAGEYFLSRNFDFSPVVTNFSVGSPINENDSATVNGIFSDLDVSDTHTVIVTWGTGEGSTTLSLAAGVLMFSATHQYLNDNPSGTSSDDFSVGVTVTDNHFGTGVGSTNVTVNNVAPAVMSLNSASTINENGVYTLNGTFHDAGTLDTHTVFINWGGGTPGQASEGSTTLNNTDLTYLGNGNWSFSASHQYLDDNATGTSSDAYAIGVRITDSDTGLGSGGTTVTVNNVAPVVAAVSGPSSGVRGQAMSFSGSFTDVGTQDTHEVRWDFGDGSVIDFHSTTDPNALTAPGHVYAASGVYTLTLGVRDDDGGIKPAPVSAVISTRVLPGKELEYRAWERKIAAAQTKAPGLQGYRFEPPVPGVQDDFVAILRFDSEANMQAWLDSPERKKLIEEAAPLTEEFHTRMARTGFEQWFRDESGAPSSASVWKMDMIVLLLLYPIVFLWGVVVGTPLLANKLNMPFAIALFVGNIFSVGMTGFMVPWVANRMGWWLNPTRNVVRANLLGAGLICAIYATCVLVFWKFF